METKAKERLTGSMLFAQSQGSGCSGIWQCHWCGAPCEDEFIHDDPPPIPFVRSKTSAKCPNEPYFCIGCWLWRRKRVSIGLLAGGFIDRQEAKNHSWYITEGNAWALAKKADYEELYHRLLIPPKKFVLALKVAKENVDTLIQLSIVNNNTGILAETPLYFTANNIPHTFSVYELIESVRNGPEVYGPGIRMLWEVLGMPPLSIREKYPPPHNKEEGKKGRGRPPILPKDKEEIRNTAKRVIVASGEVGKETNEEEITKEPEKV